ncbi:MAG: D-alanyl-D-alanine carboxypeptidase, partial [Burkholderiales bacterium]
MRAGERRLHSLEKIVAIGALAAVLFVSVGFARAGDGPKLRSSVALVQDAESGETLYEKNSDTILPIASITKLMTAIVVLERELDLEQRVAVSAEDLRATRSARVRGRLRPG